MRNSDKQREAVRKSRIEYNKKYGNPMKRPEVIAKANASRAKYWKDPEWRKRWSESQSNRKKGHAPWLKEYHDMGEKRAKLREMADKAGIPLVDTKEIDIETMEKLTESLKNLPD